MLLTQAALIEPNLQLSALAALTMQSLLFTSVCRGLSPENDMSPRCCNDLDLCSPVNCVNSSGLCLEQDWSTFKPE